MNILDCKTIEEIANYCNYLNCRNCHFNRRNSGICATLLHNLSDNEFFKEIHNKIILVNRKNKLEKLLNE